jgi:hypothetical protein
MWEYLDPYNMWVEHYVPSDIIKIFRLQVFSWHLKEEYLSLIYNLGYG